jgi:hypothetical protein
MSAPLQRVGAMVATLLATLLLAGAAPALDLKLSVDPATGVVAMGGWSRRVAETGTIFYTCEDDSCGRGSIVSMRKQPQPSAPDAETMRRNEARVADSIRERAKGQVARIDIGRPAVAKDDRFSVGEITRVIVPNAGADLGMHPHWKSGYVTTATETHTLAASANSRKACDDNYNAFKFALMLMESRK